MGKRIQYQSGQILGNYNVIFLKDLPDEIKGGQSRRMGLFQCPFCNKEFKTRIDRVKRGEVKSCGCYKSSFLKPKPKLELKDLKKQSNGIVTALTPIRLSSKTDGKHRWVICKCCCGNIIEVRSDHFKSGHTISCGCLSMSKGELKIKQLLEQLNIFFEQEFVLINKQRFDFYLFDYNCAIEYDGQQHFKENSLFQESLEDNQKRDKIKNQYCKDNNIYLIRIPYTDYNILTEEYILERLNNLDKYDYNKQK